MSNTSDTVAFVTPLCPDLYTRSVSDDARTWLRLVMPNTKQMASSTLDLPEPLRPVMALKVGSHPAITVRCAYDLKPSITTSLMNMVPAGCAGDPEGAPATCCGGGEEGLGGGCGGRELKIIQ